MKKLICVLVVIASILSLCSCNDNTPTINEKDGMKTNISKNQVAEFMGIFDSEIKLGEDSKRWAFDEEYCYNVTPIEVVKETNMMIFKFSDSCASFVMLDNKIYPLCEWLGGYGFVNAVPCDFDEDGNKDLLVASSCGSGKHRSIISVFNSVSKESTILYNSGDVDLFVARGTLSFSSGKINNSTIYYQVYSAEISVNDTQNYNLADISYVATGLVGSIEIENGTPIFKLYQE